MLLKLSRALLCIYTFAAIGFCFYANHTNDQGLQLLSIGLVLAPFALLFVGWVLIALIRSPSKKTVVRQKLNELAPGLGDSEEGGKLADETLETLKTVKRSDEDGQVRAFHDLGAKIEAEKRRRPNVEQAPDEVYWAEAHMADVETGDEFRDFVLRTFPDRRLPKPPQKQIDRIATWFDKEHKKRTDYVCLPPIAVIREPRATQDVTAGGTSWFGGRPMLGDIPWPLTSNGQPMHHRATIDLAEVSAYATPPGLPTYGKLAFFAHATKEPYEGRVIYVADATAPTLPPDDLPHIFDDGIFAYGRHDYTEMDAPTEYLHWQVGFKELPMDDYKGRKSVQIAMQAAFPDISRVNLHTKAFAEICPEITQPLLWDTAKRYAQKITLAEVNLEKTMRTAQFLVDRGDDGATAKLAYLEKNTFALRKFIDEVSTWVKPHDRWDMMAASDRLELAAFMAQVTPDDPNALGLQLYYPYDLVGRNITTISEECDATFRTIARGSQALYQHLPQVVKEAVDRTHRLPGAYYWHQMFGEGVSVQVAGEEHQYDHLLLQLQTDHMMNGVWGGSVVVQYWISPEDLRNQDWDKVVVTMEAD